MESRQPPITLLLLLFSFFLDFSSTTEFSRYCCTCFHKNAHVYKTTVLFFIYISIFLIFNVYSKSAITINYKRPTVAHSVEHICPIKEDKSEQHGVSAKI